MMGWQAADTEVLPGTTGGGQVVLNVLNSK